MTSKGSTAAAASSQTQSSPECCMCGDYGIISDLFLCKLCLFRSQHRYCSNLYPKSELYSVCNWCMSQKDEPKEKAQYSSNSSSRCSQHHTTQPNNDIHGGFKLGRPIKKQQSPEGSPSSLGLKRAAGGVRSAETQRRTKNEDQIPKRKGVIKQVFKHKVRRYKLLDEVAR